MLWRTSTMFHCRQQIPLSSGRLLKSLMTWNTASKRTYALMTWDSTLAGKWRSSPVGSKAANVQSSMCERTTWSKLKSTRSSSPLISIRLTWLPQINLLNWSMEKRPAMSPKVPTNLISVREITTCPLHHLDDVGKRNHRDIVEFYINKEKIKKY